MPYSTYLPEHMGTITLSPAGPFVAGAHEELTLVYTAGTFGIDDTGMVKISWRTTSDMSKPQFDKPQAANFTTVEASNGARLEVWFDRTNIPPWANTIMIRVGRGYLRQGDTLTIRMGDRRQGSPGYRLQTNVEAQVELRSSVDAFATYEFCELKHPTFDLVAGPAVSFKAIVPSFAVVGEPFRLALVAEDMWGNPTDQADAALALEPSRPVRGLPSGATLRKGEGPRVIESLTVDQASDVELRVMAGDKEVARANPMRVVAAPPRLRRYWADLHGQSGETIGMGSAEAYFRYARELAFVDKGRPIRRSSHILVEGQTSTEAIYTADKLFEFLKGEDCCVIAHVGGRYADIKYAHDGQTERTVEVHSSWGTFEGLLHDAFDKGYRVGVVCHSDDHKGRPGATRPGASTFGAIGGLSCYFMPALNRDALFTALRQRKHYGTPGTRIFVELKGAFDREVTGFSDDPQLGPATELAVREATMGDIIRPGGAAMKLSAEVIGTAPIERVDVLHGTAVVHSVRPFSAGDLGRRVRVLWQGAEYRGRGRETIWQGKLTVTGNRIARFAAVNFLNPERKIAEITPGAALGWTSVTTGNLAGVDLWLDQAGAGSIKIETNVVSGAIDLATLADNVVAFDGGGLSRRLSVYRLPETDWSRRVTLGHAVTHSGNADLPVYIRVTQADGNQAWTSPIYLIA